MVANKLIYGLLRIPPPVVFALAAVIMWLLSTTDFLPFNFALQVDVAIGILVIGLALFVFAIAAFVSADTTVNPLAPETASHLVTTGVFAFSRNPIYLADFVLLLAWFFWLGCGMNIIVLALFVAYLTQCQIRREEQALLALFGKQYSDYCAKVRRWL